MNSLTKVLAALSMLAWCGLACSSAKKAGPGGKTASAPTIRVSFQAVDTAKKKITVTVPTGEAGQQREFTIPITERIPVVIEDRPAGLADLKKGQQIVVSFDKDGAAKIEVPGKPKPSFRNEAGQLAAVDEANRTVSFEAPARVGGVVTYLLKLNAKTQVTRDGNAATVADLQADQKVIATADDGAAVKIDIRIPPAKAKPVQQLSFHGVHASLAKVDDANSTVILAVDTVKGTQQIGVVTDGKTQVIVDGNAATVANLKANQKVIVTMANGVATRIEVETAKSGPKISFHGLHARLATVDEANSMVTLAVDTVKGVQQIGAATDDKTQVLVDGDAATVADLRADQQVIVTVADGAATKIEVQGNKVKAAAGLSFHDLHARLVAVDDANNMVTLDAGTEAQARQVVLLTDDKTQVFLDGNTATMADLQADQQVTVTATDGAAMKIEVRGGKHGSNISFHNLHLKLARVDEANNIVVVSYVAAGTGKIIQFALATDEKTEVIINTQAVTVDHLKEKINQQAIISVANGVAVKIEVPPDKEYLKSHPVQVGKTDPKKNHDAGAQGAPQTAKTQSDPKAAGEEKGDAYLKLAESYLAAGLTAKAREVYASVVKEFPDTPAAAKAAKAVEEIDKPG